MDEKAQGTNTLKEIATMKEVTTMVYFMCCGCGYLLKLSVDEGPPPHECPACGQPCAFVNVTSYRPEVGEGNPDPQIMASLLKQAETRRMATAQSAPRARGLLESYRVDALCREAALAALRDLLEQKKKAGLLRVRKPVTRERLTV